MEIVLKLYTYVDGVNDTPFPNAEEQAMFTFTYDAGRMSGAPQISATVKHRLCLDDLWNDKVYAEFRGEKYFIMNTPSSDKDNTDERYNHDIELLSEREVLNHVYFIDAVQGDSTVDVYKSNSTKVVFFGDVNEFVGRLNACLSYQKLDYTAVVDEGVISEDKQVSFEDKYILEALQEIFNVYEIPYYFVGKTIHVGFTENTITYPLKYGFDEALLSISKQNANYALINKIKGQGSSDNIPYYYPNNSPKGDIGIKIVSGSMIASNFVIFDYVKFSSAMSLTDVCTVRREQSEDGILNYFIWSIDGKDVELSDLGIRLADNVIPMAGSSFMQEKVSYITPMPNLMPSIYRESLGAQQFYEAKNNTYEDGEGGYYEFENEYSDTNQRQGTTDFEDIKPTIEGMTNARGQRIDMFSAFAYDKNDNDEVDEEGNYIHSYFFAKLRKFDGENGFNLFDHAIESQAMQISFTSGVCGACTFEIGVGEETQKNIVQVDEFGNLKRDESGNVLWENQTPQDRQNDTRNYEVWIALKKEDSTYGIVFPNASQKLKPSTDDTFVILGINLPTAYITAAEKRLEQSLIKYMWMNNTEKFTFSIKFSRIFFTEHPEVLEQLNENSRVLVEYNGQQHTLYVDNFSYKTDDSSPLPEIEIDLVDTLSVGQNSLQTQLDSVKQDILSSIGGGDFLKQGLKYFLRKDVADTAQKKITFREGIDIGAFESDISGGTFRKMQDGSSYAEVDKLKVRVKAYFETLEIQNINSVGGKQIITPGGGVYVTEVVDRETVDGTEVVWDYYRCYFLTQQDGREIENRFKVGDLAISQNFNVKEGVSSQVTNHYYWREVVGVGDDYIDLSKSICDTDSDEPAAEDVICQLGNRTDVDRQGAIVFSAVDEFSPSITLYQGINDFSYVGKDYVSYGLDKTTGKSFFRVYGEMYVGDREQNTYIKYTQDNGVEIKGKLVTQTGKDVESTLNSFQDQIDGVKETFYGEYTPTLENYPANEWTTEADKERHIGDVFTNIQAYVDDETTPDAGKSWRWMKNDEDGTYYWLQIADSDTSKAYYEAAKANQAAQEAKEQVTELNTTVDGLQNFTDEAFKDGIVDRSEASSISTYLNNIKSIQNSVTESYNKVYNNELLEGTDKTNLLNAYNSFNNATNELVSTIEGAIADGLVDTLEKASVDGKYDTFNTKYGDFIAYINAANKYIQDKINATAKDALDKIGEMSYITDALKQYTTIEGGLIQSSLLALGYTDTDGFRVMSGTNGIYNAEKLGGGIASWWGGAMFDRFEYTEETMPSNVATGLVRFDGTGYFANGNLWWEKDGTLHADPLSFFVGEETVGDVLGLFQFIKDGDTTQYVIPQYPFQKLEVANDLRIGKAYLKWDETNNALYVVGEDGSSCNFYSLGELSAGGFSDEGGSGTGSLFGIIVNGETYTPENGYITLPDYSTGASILGVKVNGSTYKPVDGYITIPDYPTELSWGAITGKPTTLAGYGITDAYTKTESDGRYVKKSGDTITGTLILPSITTFSSPALMFSSGARIGSSNTGDLGIYGGGTIYIRPNSTEVGSDKGLVLTSSTFTFNNNTIWHAGNDGSGSGLDADLLDGHHYTDIINGNVASATKLQTPRTIWGQSFDGTGNVSGDMYNVGGINASGKIKTAVDGAAYYFGIDGHYIGSNAQRKDFYIWGIGAYDFRIGTNETERIRVTKNGDVGINTLYPSYKCHVEGTFYASGAATLGSTLNVAGLVTATAGLTTPQYIQIGKGRIYWDEANNALYVKSSDGSSAINFYSLGELSAGGYEEGSSEDIGNIFGIKVNGQTYKPVEGYITIPDYPTSLTWANITGKPSWIGATKPSYSFSEITGKPSTIKGYGITDAYIKNGTIVLGSNNITPLTSSNYSGTLDDRYVKKSGDTMTGSLTIPVGSAGFMFGSEYAGGRIVTTDATTMYIQGGDSGKLYITARNIRALSDFDINSNKATINSNTIWHAGNDGSGSGLDADLLDGVHNGSLTAAYTHDGAIRANRVIHKSDNGGNPTYFIIADCTDTVNASSAGKHYGFTGIIIEKRTDGFINEYISRVTARVGYSMANYSLKSDSNRITPCILKNGSNYYLALKSLGSGHQLYLYGFEINLLSTFTQISTTDSAGTLPDGYSIAYSGSGMDFFGNITSATKLQTPRTIWGQSFDGTGNVSGDMYNVGGINASGKIKTAVDGAAYYFGIDGHYIGSNAQRKDFYIWGIGAYDFRIGTNETERIRVTKNGDVGINTLYPSYKCHVEGTFYASGAATLGSTLNVAGLVTASNGIVTDYDDGMWIEMATRSNVIRSNQNQKTVSAHALYRVKNSNGDAIVFGGLGVNTGFYGFTDSRISSEENGYDWATYWNVGTGDITHEKGLSIRAWLTVGSTATVSGKLSANGGIYTTDISGNGSALYLGNSNNSSYVYLREDMKSSDGNWALTKAGNATFYTLLVNGTSTFSSKTTHNGGIAGTYETLSSYLTVSGYITCSSNISAAGEVAAGSSSDARLKSILEKQDYAKRLLSLGMVVDYEYNDLAFTRNVRSIERRRYTGLIYQNVKDVLPQMAGEDEDGYGYLNYIHTDYINLIAGALQQTILKQETIEQRVERLERENAELKEKISKLAS